MIPVSDAPPPGVVDRRDGNTKGECGITTIGCLFCKDQISASREYVEQYGKIKWAGKNGCPMATCPKWNRDDCWLNTAEHEHKPNPKKECPVYLRWKQAGVWEKKS